MNRVLKRFALPRVLLILFCIFPNSAVRAFDWTVKGTVEDKSGTPIPGLTVSIVHLMFDPSLKEMDVSPMSSTVTDSLGRYMLTGHLLDVKGNEFIEVYWDNTLIYRSTPLTIDPDRTLVHDITLK